MTNEKLTETIRLNNLTKQIINPLIEQVYYKDDDANKTLRDTLTIKSQDSTVAIVQKMLLFFMGCNKLSQDVEEHLLVNKAIEQKSEDRVIVEIKVRSDKRFYQDHKGKVRATGYLKFRIPNIDLNYVSKNKHFFRELQIVSGKQSVIYTLTDGHQLKLRTIDLNEGHRLMNYLLKAVDPSKTYGKSEEHSYIGAAPKDSGTSPLYGETLHCYKVVYVDALTGKSNGAKLY
jgi:hypothetical protein